MHPIVPSSPPSPVSSIQNSTFHCFTQLLSYFVYFYWYDTYIGNFTELFNYPQGLTFLPAARPGMSTQVYKSVLFPPPSPSSPSPGGKGNCWVGLGEYQFPIIAPQDNMGWTGWKLTSLNAPGIETHLSHPILGRSEFHFPIIGPLG